jgi:hypothetical protein
MNHMIGLLIQDPPLARALASRLRLNFEVRRCEPAESFAVSVLVTTTRDTAPADVTSYEQAGVRVIVLATGDQLRDEYLRAGVSHFLQMSADAGPLVRAIEESIEPAKPAV